MKEVIMGKQTFWKAYMRLHDEGDGVEGNSDASGQLTVTVQKDERGRDMFVADDGRRLFSQDHLNFEIGQVRMKEGQKNKELITQLEEVRDRKTTSESLKAELESQIEQLQQAQMTEKQQAEAQIKKLKKDYEKTQQRLTDEANQWKRQYTDSRIANEIAGAAEVNGAFSSEQILGLLRQRASLRNPIGEDGKPIEGRFEVIVEFDDHNDDGQAITLSLTPDEAIKKMKETPERFGNLFKSSQKGGLGESTLFRSSSGKVDFKEIKNMKQYEEARKAFLQGDDT